MKQIIFFLFLLHCLNAQDIDWDSRRQFYIENINLIQNHSFQNSENWILEGDSQIDMQISYLNDNSGSLKITAPYPQNNFSWVSSDFIPVEPNKIYTISAFVKMSDFPSSITLRHDSFNSYYNYIGMNEELHSVPDTAQWYEITTTHASAPDEYFLKIKFLRTYGPNYTGSIWIDEIYAGEGTGFRERFSPKIEFTGSKARIDPLGNFEIKKGNQWKPFFPLAVFGDYTRPSWNLYSEQGFNTVICDGYEPVQWCSESVSQFNPDGLYAGLLISECIKPSSPVYNQPSYLTNELNIIHSENLTDNVLLFFWDNENSYDEWEVPITITNTVKENDLDSLGERMHPIIVLQGNNGLTRMYGSMADAAGDYVDHGLWNQGDYTVLGHSFENFQYGSPRIINLDNIEKQILPAVWGQVSETGTMSSGEFRTRIYNHIISGGKAFGYWRDMYSEESQSEWPGGVPIDQQPWWNSLPQIRNEIDSLLPIIRTPHWTEWSASADSKITIGTRTYEEEAYLIICNSFDSGLLSQIEIDDLDYSFSEVRDYFSGEVLENADIFGSSFSIHLNPYETRVLYIPKDSGINETGYCISYNNPVRNVLNVKYDKYVNFVREFRFYNVLGQEVFRAERIMDRNHRMSIIIPNEIPSGILFFKVFGDEGFTGKFLLLK